MSYLKKYIKYKNKYLELISLIGGCKICGNAECIDGEICRNQSNHISNKKITSSEECANCHVSSSKKELSFCSKCRLVKYCSRECQLQHWKEGHKQRCIELKDRKPYSAADSAADSVAYSVADSVADSAADSVAYSVADSAADSAAKETSNELKCANCANHGSLENPLSFCSKCHLVKYCSRECQLQHWKEGHKLNCLKPEQKSSTVAESTSSSPGKLTELEECVICMEFIKKKDESILTCGHIFHKKCLDDLLNSGLSTSNLCPLCRNPISQPDKLYMDGLKLYEKCKKMEGQDKKDCLTLVKKKMIDAANQGDINAQYWLGHYIESNEYNKQDVKIWYHKAADRPNGHPNAQLKLGLLYLNGTCGVEKNNNEAYKYLKSAASKGIAEAQCIIASFYYEGTNDVEKNIVEAAKYYKLAAEQGDLKAILKYAEMLRRGEGVTKDLPKALKLLEEYLPSGIMEIKFLYGIILAEHDEKEITNAYTHIRQAAKYGLMEAQYMLGKKLYEDKILGESIKWLTRAAEQGSIYAQYNLGKILFEENKFIEANKWLTKAAEQGLTEAQYYIGIKLYEEKKCGEAIKWLTKAAKKGYVEAQYVLSHVYSYIFHNDKSIPQDESKRMFIYWLKEAAKNGHLRAQESIIKNNY